LVQKINDSQFFFPDPDWINCVHVSFSPNLEHICFGHGNLLVILSAKWSHDSQQNIYKISAKKVLEPNELITSLHVIPVSMQNVQESQFSSFFS
jgi:Rab3 GTPase-activating protein regulatory subunit N-terminus